MTSVEWLQQELMKSIYFQRLINDLESKKTQILPNVFEQAKEMHKQEIIKAFDSGVEDDGYIDNAEQYYQETFVNKGSDEVELPKQETLYTEYQVREAILKASLSDTDFLIDRCDEIIQSLKK